ATNGHRQCGPRLCHSSVRRPPGRPCRFDFEEGGPMSARAILLATLICGCSAGFDQFRLAVDASADGPASTLDGPPIDGPAPCVDAATVSTYIWSGFIYHDSMPFT